MSYIQEAFCISEPSYDIMQPNHWNCCPKLQAGQISVPFNFALKHFCGPDSDNVDNNWKWVQLQSIWTSIE